jgi:flagellar M-ring protein FliF
MNFFNDLIAQGRATLLAMPVGNRIIAVGLLGAIFVGLGILLRQESTGGGEYLFGGTALTEDELTRAEFAFSKAELRLWHREGNRLRVPVKEKDRYLRALAEDNAMPRKIDWATEQILNSTNVFEPNQQRESRLHFAEIKDLERSIEAFPEVRTAYLKPAIGRHGLNGTKTESASVIIIPEGSQVLSEARKATIRRLVAAAYPGMDQTKVQVTDTNAPADGGGEFIEGSSPFYIAKRRYENEYEQKLYNLLSVYGPIRVAVTAEVDRTMEEKSSSINYQGTPVTLLERNNTKTNESVRPGSGGVPGVASNAYGNKPNSVVPEQNATSKSNDTQEAVDRVVGQEKVDKLLTGFPLKSIRASISIPTSHYELVHRQEWIASNPEKNAKDVPSMSPAERETLKNKVEKKIQQQVAGILPAHSAGDDRFPNVTVVDYIDPPQTEKSEATAGSSAVSWLASSWESLAMVGLAVVALLMVRSFGKSPSPADAPDFAEGFGIKLPEIPKDELALSPQNTEAEGDPKLDVTGENLKDQLTTLIDTNPDAAANILRMWIESDQAA